MINDKQVMGLNKGSGLLYAGAVMAVLLAGALLVWWTAQRADREMREDLLQQARIVAQTLNIDRVKALSGTETDLTLPVYQLLKEQLSVVRQANEKWRFLYFLGRKTDGKVFIYVDSEPVDSGEYSRPGQVYEKAPEDYRRVFDTRTAAVEGPVSVRWGTRVTALVPITDPKTAMSGQATPEDARAMARKAVDYYLKNGRERFLKEMNNPQGEFCKGDLYAFAYDLSMTMVAHPVRPELIGQNLLDKKDWAGGKYFRAEIQRVALSRGSGWVDYQYENPVSKQLDLKTTYVELADNLIICSGAYKGTGAILAVLGIDVNGRTWKWDLARAALPPILLTLALMTIILTGVTLLSRRSRIPGAPPYWMRRLEPALVVGVGLTLTLFAAWTVHDSESNDRTQSFGNLAASKTSGLAETLRNIRDVELEGLANYCIGSKNITSEEFKQYTHYLTKSPNVQAWEWIPAVSAVDKSRFEQAARAVGLTGFEIWQKDAQGKQVPVSGREMYYPVFRVAPLFGNERALGYDLGSEPVRRAALEDSARSGLMTGTDPITLVQETGVQKGMLIYRPVFGDNKLKGLRGFALAVLRLGTVLKSANPDQSASIELFLLRRDRAPELLAASYDADRIPTSGLSATRPILAFGKVFSVSAHAGPEFEHLHPVRAGWLTALTGLLLTAALTFTVGANLRRREELERLVTDRTSELRESEEKYRAIIENIEEGYIEVDLTGRLTFFNEAALNFLGYSREEMIGMHYKKYVDEENARNIFRAYSDVYKTGVPLPLFEWEVIRKDGTRRTVEGSASLIADTEGRPVGFRGLFRDITDRRRLQDEHKQLQERLQRVEKMEALGTLAGGVAHDLNNVLGVLVGYSELLLQNVPQDSPFQRHAMQIFKGGQRAAAIIQDLLTLTRRGVLISETMNLNRIISDFLQMPEFEAIKSHHPGVQFKTFLDAQLLNIKGSSTHLSKTVMNLLSNAAESISGSGEVLIRTENRYVDRPIHGYDTTKEGEYAVLTISDTGSGISLSDIGRIFEPFYTKKVMGRSGTGLGLAVVWGTVKDHDGYIDVQSTEGKGSIFTLYFPVTREDLTKAEQVVPQSTYMGRGEHILVVDDVEGQRLLASAMLDSLGYKVSSVASGEEAIEFVRNTPVDLLILDMIMDPGIDGLDTYQSILTIRQKQKAIIVSGFSETDRVRTAQTLGAGAYIRKPYIIEKLGLAVRKELDRK